MRSQISHGCDLPLNNTSSITIKNLGMWAMFDPQRFCKNLKFSLLGTQPFVCNSLACRTSVHFILGLNANFSLHPHPHLKLDDALCCLFAGFMFHSSLFPVALSVALSAALFSQRILGEFSFLFMLKIIINFSPFSSLKFQQLLMCKPSSCAF